MRYSKSLNALLVDMGTDSLDFDVYCFSTKSFALLSVSYGFARKWISITRNPDDYAIFVPVSKCVDVVDANKPK